MYVCICRSVTDKQIRRAAAGGVDTLYELQQALGVATGCGTCRSDAEAILSEANESCASPRLYVPSLA